MAEVIMRWLIPVAAFLPFCVVITCAVDLSNHEFWWAYSSAIWVFFVGLSAGYRGGKKMGQRNGR